MLITLLYSIHIFSFNEFTNIFFDLTVNEPDPFGDLTESEEYNEVKKKKF